MSYNLTIKNGITIPENEIEITASRSGGAGGQHVNKTSTRITVRWNIKETNILNDEQKSRILEKLSSQVTNAGDLIIHNSTSRSQDHNKKAALNRLAEIVRKALVVPKKRIPKAIPESIRQARLEHKKKRSETKKLRSKKISYTE